MTLSSQTIYKWSKRLLLLTTLLPVLLFLGFASAISLMDFNQYKPQIEQELTKRSGHEVRIDGQVEVSVLPFSFSLEEVTFKNTPQFVEAFGEENLLSIQLVQAEVSLWKLFVDKQFSVTGLELMEPRLVLLQDRDGSNWHPSAQPLARGQWDDGAQWQRRYASLVSADETPVLRNVAASAADHGREMKAAAPGWMNWQFDSVVVKQGHFELQDAVVNHQAVLSDLNLLAFDASLAEPFQVRADFNYHNTLKQRHYQFDVTALLNVSADFLHWQVTDWQGAFKLKLARPHNVPEMRLTTRGRVFDLNLLDEQMQVVDAKLEALGSSIRTSFSGRYGEQPHLYGSVVVEGVNVPSWGRHLGVQMPVFVKKQALTRVSGQFDWQLAEHKLSLNEIALQVDDSTLRGQLWHQAWPNPQAQFDLQIDRLNLDDYRAVITQAVAEPAAFEASQQTAEAEEVPHAASQDSDTPQTGLALGESDTYLPLAVPIQTLRTLQAQGQLQIGQLTAWQMEAHHFSVEVQAKQGRLALSPFEAELYQGRLSSSLILDVNGDTPAYQWRGQLDNTQVAPLLTAGGQPRSIDGRLNAAFDLLTAGSNPQALSANLQGELKLEVKDGHFYGLDLDNMLQGKAAQAQDKTPFTSLQLAGGLKNGVLDARSMSVKSPRFSGQGKGSLDINQERVQARMALLLTRPPAHLAHLKGVKIPLFFQGPLSQPVWRVDLHGLLNEPANQEKLLNQLKSLLQAS